MKKKICPYCDQPMGDGMYCRGCKRIVLRPEVWNVDYYLNGRHSASEENCQYHGDLHTGEMRKKAPAVLKNGRTGKTASSGSTAAKRASSANSGSGSRNRAESSQNGKTKSPFSRVAPLLVIYFVLMFGGTLVNLAANLNFKNAYIDRVFDKFQPDAPEYEAPVQQAGEELPEAEAESQMEEWERSDEEVIAAGVACNAYGHFPVYAAELQEIFEMELTDSGRTEWTEDSYSYNSVHDEFTWFETENYYDYYDSDGSGYTMILNSDTATGEIHGVLWYTEEKEELLELADVVVKSLKKVGIAEDVQDGRELYEEASGTDDLVVLSHGLEIRVVDPEAEGGTLYQMMLFAPGYYTEGE